MIPLVRDRRKAAVHASFRGDKRVAMARLLEPGPDGTRKFDASKWKAAKKQLKAESCGKCAYCEGLVGVVAHGDVEHFRPKSVYWWLAYCYDNYLLACQICNQVYKGDRFPIDGLPLPGPDWAPPMTVDELAEHVRLSTVDPCEEGLGMPYDAFRAALEGEKARLINPYYDDPGRHFAWQADDVLKEVRLVPITPEAEPYIRAAEEGYGLNRDELLRARFRQYDLLNVLRLAVQAPALDQPMKDRVLDQLRKLIAPDASFAGMARYFVVDVWKVAGI